MTIRIINYTKSPHMILPALDCKGRKFYFIILKGVFDIKLDGTTHLSNEQEPIVFSDQYFGEVNTSDLYYPSDNVPYKPNTDIIFDCYSTSPSKNKERQWTAGYDIYCNENILNTKKINVYGNRYWKKNDNDYYLTDPELVSEVSLNFSNSYGGSFKYQNEKKEILVETNEYNPIGVGFMRPNQMDNDIIYRAPQIELLTDPIKKPFQVIQPASLGPVPPAWLPRRPRGGTYDKKWLDEIWPNWPPDYNFHYNNSAPDDQQILGLIEDDFSIQFLNILDNLNVKFQNPIPYFSKFINDDWQTIRMPLDTVFFDIGKLANGDNRMICLWRSVLLEDDIDEIQIYYAINRYYHHIKRFKRLFPVSSSPDSLFTEGVE